MMKRNNPSFMLIYQCETCGLDSGYTEIDKNIKCYYCEETSKMKLISKKVLTPEVMADRLRTITDRMFSNLQSAYESMNNEDKNILLEDGNDMEKEMLDLLGKAKEFKEKIHQNFG